MTIQITSEQLAAKFSAVLREWLTPEQMDEVVRRNDAQSHPLVCHSHDFCDANMAMLEAAESFGFTCDEMIQDERAQTLWNDAWSLAKARGFDFSVTENAE